MDKSKIIKIRGENKYLAKLIIGGVTLLVIFYTVINFLISVGHPFDVSQEQDKRAALGALGDYFGGLLNPLFAFLSFMGVLWTLRMSRDELLETRTLMNEQLKTQFLQQFESLFFSLLNQMSRNLEQLMREDKSYGFSENYRKIFNIEVQIEKTVTQLFGLPTKEDITMSAMRASLIEDKNFSNFFIFLYQILKNIDKKIDGSKLFGEDRNALKKSYFNIVRSLIPEKLLHLLLLNVCVGEKEYNFDKYKDIVERAEFFEHFNFAVDKKALYPILLCSTSMEKSAFGSNKQFEVYLNHEFVKGLSKDVSGCFFGRMYEILSKNNSSININKEESVYEVIMKFNENSNHTFLFKKSSKVESFNEVLYKNETTCAKGVIHEFELHSNNLIELIAKDGNNKFKIQLLLGENSSHVISII